MPRKKGFDPKVESRKPKKERPHRVKPDPPLGPRIRLTAVATVSTKLPGRVQYHWSVTLRSVTDSSLNRMGMPTGGVRFKGSPNFLVRCQISNPKSDSLLNFCHLDSQFPSLMGLWKRRKASAASSWVSSSYCMFRSSWIRFPELLSCWNLIRFSSVSYFWSMIAGIIMHRAQIFDYFASRGLASKGSFCLLFATGICDCAWMGTSSGLVAI